MDRDPQGSLIVSMWIQKPDELTKISSSLMLAEMEDSLSIYSVS